MIDFTKPIYSRHDGTYVATVGGNLFHVAENTPEVQAELKAYLTDHPEALVPEPVPPPPTPEERAAVMRAQIVAQLADIDRRAIRPLRAVVAGTATEADQELLAELESQAAALRAELGSIAG